MRMFIIFLLGLTGFAVVASPPVQQHASKTRSHLCQEVVAELRIAEQEGLINSRDVHGIMTRCYNRSITPLQQP